MIKQTKSSGVINTKARVCLSIVLFLCVLPTQADNKQNYQKSVNNIAKEIKQISVGLNANRKLLKTQKDKLFNIEKQITQLKKDISSNQALIIKTEQSHRDIQLKIEQMTEQHTGDMQALSNLIKERYMQGKPNYLKMVLNQENPYAVGRLNNYYDYFSKAQQVKIKQLRAKLQYKQELELYSEQAIVALQEQQQTLLQQQNQLSEKKKKRRDHVATLNKKVVSSTNKIKQLEKDRGRLNKLLVKIEAQAKKLRELEKRRAAKAKEQQKDQVASKKNVVRPLVKGGFLKQKGRLKYPVTGKQKYRFGSRMAGSEIRAQGMFFDTSKSVSITSIFSGRVLFADHLKGYGLLLIIDHGDQHISLYGHNEVIYKQVGDRVETNERVAKTGTSGGLKSPGLYFEIRKGATPVDPAKWCQ